MTQPVRVAVIMAGGAGERFWPLSRQGRPKQLLCLTRPDQTMLAEAVERIAPLVAPERVFVATSAALVEPIRQAGVGVPPENIIAEPCRRNTAGCLSLAAAFLKARFPGQRVTMAVLTADHQIGKVDCFLKTVDTALSAAHNLGALVTIGIQPTRPETGYGYIEAEQAGGAQSAGAGGSCAASIFPVKTFREKPNLEAAREYVESGRFFWNSGMFFWDVDVFTEEMRKACPAHGEAIEQMAQAFAQGKTEQAHNVFEGLQNISIDYALMEKARHVLVVRAEFPWDDVGSLDALERSWPTDAQGNVVHGDPLLVDTRDSIIYNEAGAESIAVGVVGLEGLVVVVTRDGVLVAPKERVQEVKKIVEQLKDKGASHL